MPKILHFTTNKIYVNWMSFIINCILPLALLIGMNIRIYVTMKNQWSMPSARVENSIKLGSKDNQKDENVKQVTSITIFVKLYTPDL